MEKWNVFPYHITSVTMTMMILQVKSSVSIMDAWLNSCKLKKIWFWHRVNSEVLASLQKQRNHQDVSASVERPFYKVIVPRWMEIRKVKSMVLTDDAIDLINKIPDNVGSTNQSPVNGKSFDMWVLPTLRRDRLVRRFHSRIAIPREDHVVECTKCWSTIQVRMWQISTELHAQVLYRCTAL